MTVTPRRFVLKGIVAALAATVLSPVSKAAAGMQQPQTHQVKITKFKFIPDTLTVRPGDTITWTNTDFVPHTATADDKSWDTGKIAKNDSASVVVGIDFRATYFCRFHPNMKASLEVAGES